MPAGRITKPILDTRTGKEYRSQAAAGRELAHLVKGDPSDTFVWFKVARELPGRFRTRNKKGEWVPLDDASAPVGTLRVPEDELRRPSATGTRITTVEIDESKYELVKVVLGAQTLRETVDRAFDEVLVTAARARSLARLQRMEGLDLDKPSVMEKAWR